MGTYKMWYASILRDFRLQISYLEFEIVRSNSPDSRSCWFPLCCNLCLCSDRYPFSSSLALYLFNYYISISCLKDEPISVYPPLPLFCSFSHFQWLQWEKVVNVISHLNILSSPQISFSPFEKTRWSILKQVTFIYNSIICFIMRED